MTCVPDQNLVDLGRETDLPDVCAGIDCGDGTCVALGGFPSCDCPDDSGAIYDETLALARCQGVAASVGDPGANNYTPPLQDVQVCAPEPPDCGERGWLVPRDDQRIRGVMCESSTPTPEQLAEPEPPTCEQVYGETATPVDPMGESQDGEADGCSCTSEGGRGIGSVLLSMLVLGTLRLRRRRR